MGHCEEEQAILSPSVLVVRARCPPQCRLIYNIELAGTWMTTQMVSLGQSKTSSASTTTFRKEADLFYICTTDGFNSRKIWCPGLIYPFRRLLFLVILFLSTFFLSKSAVQAPLVRKPWCEGAVYGSTCFVIWYFHLSNSIRWNCNEAVHSSNLCNLKENLYPRNVNIPSNKTKNTKKA